MLELSLIVFGICSLAAFFGGKVGYHIGTKRAATEIADFFCREITSSDNDLKTIPALLARRSMLADKSLREIASKLHVAAWHPRGDALEFLCHGWSLPRLLLRPLEVPGRGSPRSPGRSSGC
jgi:hypothetical protein